MRNKSVAILFVIIGITTCLTLAAGDSGDSTTNSRELPTYKIPNLLENGEAYYAPDGLYLIAQINDPDAQDPGRGKVGGALTYTFTDRGEDILRINDRGMDACSWFYPDKDQLLWTSTRDHINDFPAGNWSDDQDYPQGAELYSSDLDGGNVRRLTNNEWYDAECTVSPDGKWIVFGRQINGNADLWRMKSDGTEQTQLTFTEDWQEGEAYFLPDNKTVIFRAWKQSEKLLLNQMDERNGTHTQTPMNIFTLKFLGQDLDVQQRTFTHDMNWAPFPAPDGKHFLVVRIVGDHNWELFLCDLADGSKMRQITFNEEWDGMGAFSPDGKKMVYTRSDPGSWSMYSYVMDVSSLNLGTENYSGVPAKSKPPTGWVENPADFAPWR
jgi:WD40 repeat protein|tara:strand:- start:4465 stop:5610 length:1146 start_codon:yes stop_codon:yes gene_type:complete